MNGSGEISEETRTWLDERAHNGNWFDIHPDDEFPDDIIGWNRTFYHMFQIQFAPEIRRRIEDGRINENSFVLHSAQLIQPMEGKPFVRLNDEVRGVAKVRASRTLQKGDPVTHADMEGIESFDLPEDELDCGHFTLFNLGQQWCMFFDFTSGREKASKMLDAAREFLAAVRQCHEASLARPCVDNLFSACELIAKARLILHRDPATQSKKHGALHSSINKWRKLGNVDADFVRLFNRLTSERPAARYDQASAPNLPTETELALVEREIEALKNRVAHLFAREDSNENKTITEAESQAN